VTEPRIVPLLVSELRLPPRERELLGREWWPSYAHAVIHRDGVFLFDNGAGRGNAVRFLSLPHDAPGAEELTKRKPGR